MYTTQRKYHYWRGFTVATLLFTALTVSALLVYNHFKPQKAPDYTMTPEQYQAFVDILKDKDATITTQATTQATTTSPNTTQSDTRQKTLTLTKKTPTATTTSPTIQKTPTEAYIAPQSVPNSQPQPQPDHATIRAQEIKATQRAVCLELMAYLYQYYNRDGAPSTEGITNMEGCIAMQVKDLTHILNALPKTPDQVPVIRALIEKGNATLKQS